MIGEKRFLTRGGTLLQIFHIRGPLRAQSGPDVKALRREKARLRTKNERGSAVGGGGAHPAGPPLRQGRAHLGRFPPVDEVAAISAF